MSQSGRIIKPKVRKADIEDFESVYPLLQELNNTRLNKSDWYNLFQNHWHLEEFSPGMVLQAGEEIVGYLGTIYSKQMLAGKMQLFCNLTSWIVRDEYRNHSVMMLLPLLRNKSMILTSFSSNNITYELYKKLGFKDGNRTTRIIYRWPSIRTKDYRIFNTNDEISKKINGDLKTLFNDHLAFGNICILVEYQHEQCLLMGVKRKHKLKIYFVSDRLFLQKHLQFFRGKLMSYYNVKQLLIDEQLLADARIFLSRKVDWGYPYQLKTSNDACKAPMPVYSERFILNM